MKTKVVVVDYGLGNTVSAKQTFLKAAREEKKDFEVIISNNPEEIKKSTHIVLPGQGAFSSCMGGLRNISGMIDVLQNEVLKEKKPFLGICIGMQLLADKSYENGEHEGFGWIPGSIQKIAEKGLKLPHMGWNNINLTKNLTKVDFSTENNDFYFVHSYYFKCLDKQNIVATTNYGINFPSIVAKENIYGVQFHPEKSSTQGLKLIKNFLSL